MAWTRAATATLLAHTVAVAEDERRRITRRTREGMARIRTAIGKPHGRAEPHPADVVARIITSHADGCSASAIARLFNDEGVPKGEGSSPLWNSHVVAAVRREQVRRAASVG